MDLATRDMLHQLISTWNTHNLDQVVTFYASDYVGVDIGLAQHYLGLAGIRQMATHYYTAFPDLIFSLTQTLVEGDNAVVSWQSTGTHVGKIMNIPASHRLIHVSGITTFKVRDNLVAHSSVLWDVAGLLREIGLLPDL